eukprot:8413997-Lingulodinium_polyedra.AAC.1
MSVTMVLLELWLWHACISGMLASLALHRYMLCSCVNDNHISHTCVTESMAPPRLQTMALAA